MRVPSACRHLSQTLPGTSALLGAALCAAFLAPGCATAPTSHVLPGSLHELSATDAPAGGEALGELAGRRTDGHDSNEVVLSEPSTTPVAAAPEDEWKFMIAPYVWMFGVKGNATAKGQKVGLDVSFNDILDNLDFAGMVHMEAWNGDWGFSIDPIFGRLSTDGHAAGNDYDADMDLIITDAVAMGHITKEGDTQLDGIMGVRYWQVGTDLDSDTAGIHNSSTTDWVDPIVGMRAITQFTENWDVTLRGDVGGFGIGSAAEEEWSATASLGYSFNPHNALIVGYRWLNIDKSSGGGATETGLNAQISGPAVGWAFSF